ncbi:TIGR00366 family protein [Algoriphagus sp. AK58]|uniref:TIGR00366 family protein n=1 Tax=Algoriphagus sp. AK58 TaxID=1406877 RepID=UPI00351C0F15
MGKTQSRNFFQSLLTPFGLVLLLTLVTFWVTFFTIELKSASQIEKAVKLVSFWQDGFFSLLGFTLQMIMILVFGYALAVYEPVNKLLRSLAGIPDSLVSGSILVASITMIAGLLNWGFGLIIGALLARSVQESLVAKGISSNSALLAAAGYLGMGIWHGGLSGSAPLTVAGEGHFLQEKIGLISVSKTLFSSFNLITTSGLFLVFLFTVWGLSKTANTSSESVSAIPMKPISQGKDQNLARVVGVVMLAVLMLGVVWGRDQGLGMISLNWVNFLLFSLVLIAFRSWDKFILAVGEGLKASVDILVQFPFYAGILGLLSSSGVLLQLADYIQSLTNPEFFPLITFYSAAFVNLLIPSGGGQWAIQGPVILEAAKAWGMDLGKMTMIFSYGDQITNLLQPFWALPLLSITGVSVRRLFPYCLILFLSGFVFLTLAIWILY